MCTMCRCLCRVAGEVTAGLVSAFFNAWGTPPCSSAGGKSVCRGALAVMCLLPIVAVGVGLYLLAKKLEDI